MKLFCLILSFIFFILPACADTVITGGINYNVTSARNELMNNSNTGINPNLISANVYDLQHNENIANLLNGTVSLKDRTLALFSDNTYAVMYFKDPLHVFYYSADGVLNYTEEKSSTNYPYKSYKYDTSGKLVNMGLRVSKGETFIYTPQGRLIAHWIDSNGYDEKRKVIMKRKYIE